MSPLQQQHHYCRDLWLFSKFQSLRLGFRCPFRIYWFIYWNEWANKYNAWIPFNNLRYQGDIQILSNCLHAGVLHDTNNKNKNTVIEYCATLNVLYYNDVFVTCIDMIHLVHGLNLAIELESVPLLDLAEHWSHTRYTELVTQTPPAICFQYWN